MGDKKPSKQYVVEIFFEKNGEHDKNKDDQGRFEKLVIFDKKTGKTETIYPNDIASDKGLDLAGDALDLAELKTGFDSKSCELMVNGGKVSEKEFQRRLMNIKLDYKIPISELEKIREEGGRLARKLENIEKDGHISEKEYRKLEKLSERASNRIHGYGELGG